MYTYNEPHPIVIKLTDEWGFDLREKTAKYVEENQNTTGAERGNTKQQGFGALAEIVVRNKLGMKDINDAEHSLAYDILLPSGVKVDVKCRGGKLSFKEEYESDDGIPREAKHNFFARQIYDDNLDTDIYLMTHLEHPSDPELPGTKRQRKWILYICGWVSKDRAKRDGVYLPRGSITERGSTWFQYRGQEIEFYNKNLNGLANLEDFLKIEKSDVEKDEKRASDLNLTSVDAIRIAYDLVGHGLLKTKQVDFLKKELNIDRDVKPILHSNQYIHLAKWLQLQGKISEVELKDLEAKIKSEEYTGI